MTDKLNEVDKLNLDKHQMSLEKAKVDIELAQRNAQLAQVNKSLFINELWKRYGLTENDSIKLDGSIVRAVVVETQEEKAE